MTSPEATINSPMFFWLLLSFLILTLIFVGWMIISRQRTYSSLQKTRDDKENISDILNSKEEYYFCWFDQEGDHRSSENLIGFLGLKEQNFSLGALSDLFCEADKQVWIKTFQSKLTAGDEFFTNIEFKDQRLIRIEGKKYFHHNRHDTGYILWFRDVSVSEKINIFQEKMTKEYMQQDNQFRLAADILSFPIWMCDENFDLKWVNKAYVDAVEASSAVEVLKQKKELVIGSAKNQSFDQTVIERHTLVIKGQRRSVDIHSISYQDTGGYKGIVAYAIDVTEIEHVKTQLQHHTESYSETLNKLSTAVAIFGSDQRLEYYNIAFLRLWRLPESLLTTDLQYSELLEIMRDRRQLPEQANFPKWKKQQLEAYTAADPVEEMWHLPDERTLRVVAQPHPSGGLLIFYEDVTDYLNLETSLNTLNAVQEATLNNLHEAVAVFGVDGRLKLYNPGFANMWRISEEVLQKLPHINEVLAVSVGNFSHVTDVEMMRELIVGGSAKREIQNMQITLADQRVIDYTSVPLPDGAVLMTYLDVTDQFKVEQALRDRNDALEESHKIKTDFLAHMSFELRNPLTSIIGFSEMLENEYVGALNDKQKDYMSSILKASGHLFSLINDILDLTTLEAGGLILDISEFDLADMMKESKERLNEALAKKNLNLKIIYPKDLKVHGDQKRLQHCFYNILANAVKFTQEDGNVTVSVELDDKDYIIKVKDNGLGIHPEELDSVYEKFYVGSNVPKGKGAGLGLSLTRSFVELHGGVIHITSNLGEGTIVRYSLPIMNGLD